MFLGATYTCQSVSGNALLLTFLQWLPEACLDWLKSTTNNHMTTLRQVPLVVNLAGQRIIHLLRFISGLWGGSGGSISICRYMHMAMVKLKATSTTLLHEISIDGLLKECPFMCLHFWFIQWTLSWSRHWFFCSMATYDWTIYFILTTICW